MPGPTYPQSRLPQPAGRVRQSKLIDRSPYTASAVLEQDSQERGRKSARAGDEHDRARRSLLSPKEQWSPSAKAVPKYQLRDPGAVPGSPPLAKRGQFPAASQIPVSAPVRETSVKWEASTGASVRRGTRSGSARSAHQSPAPSSITSNRTRRAVAVPVPSGLPEARPYIHPTSRPAGGRPASRAEKPELDSPVSNAATVATASPTRPALPTFVSESIAMPTTRTSSAIRHMRDVQVCSSSSSSEAESAPRSRLVTPERTVSPPISETDMTLIWQPDPEAKHGGPDPAEELWKEIEIRLGSHRGGRGQSLPHPNDVKADMDIEREGERGQWVLTPRQRAESEKIESEFTVSAYFDPDMTTTTATGTMPTPRPTATQMQLQGTALFDMSAPLVHSRSDDAATPVNTPVLRHETIQRKSRVRVDKGQGQGRAVPRKSGNQVTCTSLIDSVDDLPLPLPEAAPEGMTGMYRLDSHVVAALQAFAQTESHTTTTPQLEMALSASSSASASDGPASVPEDGGLGLGIHLGEVYSQPVTSPPMSMSKRAQRMRSIGSRSQRSITTSSSTVPDVKCKEVVSVMDLDTGLRRDMALHRINGAIKI